MAIYIVGAGAAGLMAARELAKNGKKVIILEARDRTGGRIYTLSKEKFGQFPPVQGGAEFVHGAAPITKALLSEAGLSYISTTDGEFWNVLDRKLVQDRRPMEYKDEIRAKLTELDRDMPIYDFLNLYFGDEKYARTKQSIYEMVEGYDAADPKQISSFYLRDDWLGGKGEWQQGRVIQGYGALIDYLVWECKKAGVEIHCNAVVQTIEHDDKVKIVCKDGRTYEGENAIVTVPLPIIPTIEFKPEIPQKLKAASQIGYGYAIKLAFQFSDFWWQKVNGNDLTNMTFILSKEKIPTWWTQFPETAPLLIGWIAGPKTEQFKNSSTEEILDAGFTSLSNIFHISKDEIKKQCINSDAIHWPNEPYTKGAYSFPTPTTEAAIKELTTPINNVLFFAGEALAGKTSATVEGALESGLLAAQRIIS